MSNSKNKFIHVSDKRQILVSPKPKIWTDQVKKTLKEAIAKVKKLEGIT